MTSFGPRAVAIAAATYATLLAAAMVPGAFWPARLGFEWTASPAWDVAIGVASGLAMAAASLPFSTRTLAGRRLAGRLSSALHGMPWWGVPVLAVASGVAEEALFRGTLHTLADSLSGGVVAVAATSVAFGAAHGLFLPGFRAWSLFALAAGVVLGVLRVHTGGVLAPAIAHATVNLVNLPVVMRVGKDFPPPGEVNRA